MNNRGLKSDHALRVLLGILGMLVVVSAVLLRVSFRTEAQGEELSLNRLYRIAGAGQIVEATLLERDARVVGRFCPGGSLSVSEPGVPDPASCPGPIDDFHAAYPRSEVITQSIVDRLGARAPVELDRQGAKQVGRQLLAFVMPPLLLGTLVALVLVARSSDASLLEAAGLGRFGRRRRREQATETAVTLADVAGAQHAVSEVAEVITYLRDPARFEAVGAPAPTGVLLAGPPGCGKTLLARAVAGESKVPFLSMAGAHCPVAAVVRNLFAQAHQLAPAVCFIDDVDALGPRSEGEGAGGEREQALNQLVVEMDALERSAGVVVIAATNRPQILDPALLSRGRFDRHISLRPPDAAGRRAILAIQAKGRPMAPEVDLDQVAARTAGFTGADLADLVNEAAVLTVRSGLTHIGSTQMSEAISRVLRGQRRRSVLTPAQLTRLATHEAGHALVATALGHGHEVQRVSVISPGANMGAMAMAGDDGVPHTAAEMTERLVMVLAGAAAEDAVLGSVSTAAEDDIGRATGIARAMVGRCGMSEAVGRVRVLAGGPESGPGDGLGLEAVSPATVEAFDAEVRRLIEAAEARAKAILDDNRSHLEAMVTRLETEEILEHEALAQLLRLVVAAPPVGTNGAPARKRSRTPVGTAAPGKADESGQQPES